MKKLTALLAIVALLGVVGCCTNPDNPNKSFGNCVAKVIKPVKSILCPPNQAQVDQAAAAASFLGSLAGQDFTNAVAKAKQVFLDIANGICVALDQLQTAVDTFDQTVVVVQGQIQIQTQPKKTVPVPDISALRKALKK